jgi:hypothetical protein
MRSPGDDGRGGNRGNANPAPQQVRRRQEFGSETSSFLLVTETIGIPRPVHARSTRPASSEPISLPRRAMASMDGVETSPESPVLLRTHSLPLFPLRRCRHHLLRRTETPTGIPRSVHAGTSSDSTSLASRAMVRTDSVRTGPIPPIPLLAHGLLLRRRCHVPAKPIVRTSCMELSQTGRVRITFVLLEV